MDPVTRRAFIKGVIAAGAAVSASSYLFRGPEHLFGQGSLPGAVERLMTLTVNGQQRRVDVMKQETLAMTLRYKLGLTGTKLGCDRSECGACTVLIDDVPHYSCSILTHTVRGKNVVSIEGLESPDGDRVADVIIGKQRNGPTGKVQVTFIPEYASFENLAPPSRQIQPV